MFRIDRIVSLNGTAERFEIPDDFSLDDYMSSAWNVMRGPAKTIKIRFTGGAARLTKEAHWHPSQTIKKEGDFVIAEYKSGGLKEICSWLLKFGGEAEVLEPPELRRMVAKNVLRQNERLLKRDGYWVADAKYGDLGLNLDEAEKGIGIID